jgi:hypothetical protein
MQRQGKVYWEEFKVQSSKLNIAAHSWWLIVAGE